MDITCQLLISGSGVRNPDGSPMFQGLFSGTRRLRGAVYAPLIAASRKSATWACTLPRVIYTSRVMLTFVTITVGNDPPTDTAPSARVTLDKIGGCWPISAFEPV